MVRSILYGRRSSHIPFISSENMRAYRPKEILWLRIVAIIMIAEYVIRILFIFVSSAIIVYGFGGEPPAYSLMDELAFTIVSIFVFSLFLYCNEFLLLPNAMIIRNAWPFLNTKVLPYENILKISFNKARTMMYVQTDLPYMHLLKIMLTIPKKDRENFELDIKSRIELLRKSSHAFQTMPADDISQS